MGCCEGRPKKPDEAPEDPMVTEERRKTAAAAAEARSRRMTGNPGTSTAPIAKPFEKKREVIEEKRLDRLAAAGSAGWD